MAKPISPSEAFKAKGNSIPDYVIEAFNELITRELSDAGVSVVKQEEVVSLSLAKAAELQLEVTRQTLFENNWLDVEGLYRDAGWSVKYDKPAFNESYAATFTFTKKRKS